MTKRKCECGDRGCPMHLGHAICPADGTTLLYRIDMHDASGTLMCAACATDALDSGIFATDERDEEVTA